MNGTNCNDNERGLLPYPVILAATKGDPDAMKIVVQHYQSYIAHLSMRKIRDESGNTYYGVDEDLRNGCKQSSCGLSYPLRQRSKNAKCSTPFRFAYSCLLNLEKESDAR